VFFINQQESILSLQLASILLLLIIIIFYVFLPLETYNEKILVVDDQLSIRQILETRLSLLGYKVILATNGEEALLLFEKEKPHVIVLDIMLPKMDGYEVCQEIRASSQVPIIMLTALGDIADRVLGLELGADDYVMKPFSPKELEARIRSVLRRAGNSIAPNLNQNVIQIANLIIDTNKRQVFKGSERVKLTGMEFNLLELLVTRAGESLSRASILDSVWGYTTERYLDTRVVDVHISRLRSKLEEDSSNPDFILTARGTGYMFQNYTTKLT
jgi:two-component system, OmpR family, response regulator RpaB